MDVEPAGRALVVYESMFGNTEQVAEAVADGLRQRYAHVDAVPVARAGGDLAAVDLLVVGAPTHAFSLSRASTRRSARDQGATGSAETGIREWLGALPAGQVPANAACFDTYVHKPFLPGSAARATRRRLRRLGASIVGLARFEVVGTPGPLADGELERARSFGRTLPGPAVTTSRRAAAS